MYKEILEYNANLCAEWTRKATESGHKIIIAVSINSLSQLQLYAVREMSPEQIAHQLRAIADKLEQNKILKIVPDGT